MTEEQYAQATPIIEQLAALRAEKANIESILNEPLNVAGIVLNPEIASFKKQDYLNALNVMIQNKIDELGNI